MERKDQSLAPVGGVPPSLPVQSVVLYYRLTRMSVLCVLPSPPVYPFCDLSPCVYPFSASCRLRQSRSVVCFPRLCPSLPVPVPPPADCIGQPRPGPPAVR